MKCAGAVFRLQRVIAALEAGRAMAPEDSEFIAGAFRAILGGKPAPMALGLFGNWLTALRAQQRDEALRQMAAALEGSDREKAKTVSTRTGERIGTIRAALAGQNSPEVLSHEIEDGSSHGKDARRSEKTG